MADVVAEEAAQPHFWWICDDSNVECVSILRAFTHGTPWRLLCHWVKPADALLTLGSLPLGSNLRLHCLWGHCPLGSKPLTHCSPLGSLTPLPLCHWVKHVRAQVIRYW